VEVKEGQFVESKQIKEGRFVEKEQIKEENKY
jgi:hypothetical protein